MGNMLKSWHERISDFVLCRRYNWVWQGLIVALAVGLVAIFAFSHLFTTFEWWDDEGYFFQIYREFLSGRIPYDQVLSPYGPVTFFGAALVAGFDAANVTHDYFRWAVFFGWMLIVFLIAGVVWRWTGRFTVAVVAFLLVGLRLGNLCRGVGHPQVWIILAVAVLLWLGLDWMYRTDKQSRAFWVGFLMGLIILCKINIGIFVSIGIGLGVSLLLRGRARALAGGVFITAAAGLGLMMIHTSSSGADRFFALTYLVSLAATVGIGFGRPVEQQPSLTCLKWLIAGLGICLLSGIGGTLAYGATFPALFGSLIAEPVLFVRSYRSPFLEATRGASILLTAAAIVTIITAFHYRRHAAVRPEWVGLLKLSVGVGLLCAFSYNQRLALTGSLLFLWLLIVNVGPISYPPYSNRLLLALLSPLFSLQIFPLAGDQVDWAALLPITAATVLLGDGVNCIEREGYMSRIQRPTRLLVRGASPLLAILLILFGGANAVKRYRGWRGAQSLNLPGTHWLRLTPAEAVRLSATASQLSQNCRTVLEIPGMYSFSLWSGVPSIEEQPINTWPFLWPDKIQKNELPKLRQQSQGCVLVSSDTYQFFKEMAVSPGNDELLREVEQTMVPIFAIQDLTLYQSSATPEPTSSSVLPPSSGLLISPLLTEETVPPMGQELKILRFEVTAGRHLLDR
jgi:hypothetical protein